MPVERRLDPDTRILWTTLRGPITIQELRDHIDAVHGEGGNHFCEVVDTRDLMETIPVPANEPLVVVVRSSRRWFRPGSRCESSTTWKQPLTTLRRWRRRRDDLLAAFSGR